MTRARRSNYPGESTASQRSLKVAGVVIALILAIEVIAIVPLIAGGNASGVQLMVIDTPADATAGSLDEAVAELTAAIEPAPPVVAQPQAHADMEVVGVPDHVAQPVAPTFAGRPLRKVRTMRMLVTAYSPDERSCGKFADGVTASGYSVWTNGMKLVAADTRLLPFKSIISIDGYNGGNPVPVLDRGGKIKGHRLDVLYPTHEIARQWGKQWIDVDVWEYAD